MKKILIVLGITLVLFLGYIYLIIPSEFRTVVMETVNAPDGAVRRFAASPERWAEWWPQRKDARFTYKGSSFTLGNVLPSEINIDLRHEDIAVPTELTVVSLSKDSTIVTWQCHLPAPSNPIKRMKLYEQWNKAAANMQDLLHALNTFVAKKDNVYKMPIQQLRVTDTLLVTTKRIISTPPSTSDIYAEIKKLRDYITGQGATATNAPMLNINRLDSNQYQFMVGIPVNKTLPGNSTIIFKRMVEGKILVAEVKGGPVTIRRAFEQLELYVQDYRKEAPAISYEMLVTDRQQNTDTSAWFTRLYYPIL